MTDNQWQRTAENLYAALSRYWEEDANPEDEGKRPVPLSAFFALAAPVERQAGGGDD